MAAGGPPEFRATFECGEAGSEAHCHMPVTEVSHIRQRNFCGSEHVKIDVVEADGGVTIVKLVGRMDIAGVSAVDMQFAVLAGSRKKVVVDMSAVDFLASLGMRTLVVAAKSISSKGGKFVLLDPQPNVEKVLTSSGIDTVIPIVHGLPAALSQVG